MSELVKWAVASAGNELDRQWHARDDLLIWRDEADWDSPRVEGVINIDKIVRAAVEEIADQLKREPLENWPALIEEAATYAVTSD